MTLILLLLSFGLLMALGVATLPAATVLTRTGLLVSGALAQAASTNDQFANTGKQMLLVRNGDSGAHVLTFITPQVVEDQGGNLTVENPTVSVAAGETRLIGPFRPSIFNNASGCVEYTIPDATGMTVKVVQLNAEAATA